MMTNLPKDHTGPEFDDLAADADEDTRRDVAEHLVASMKKLLAGNPDVIGRHADDPYSERFVASPL